MTSLGRLTVGLALALTTLLVPATARAITVECDNAFGSCQVSNDGSDAVFCSCDNGGMGSTGLDEWVGLSQAELQIVCLDQLEFCGPLAETDFGTSTFGTDSIGDTSGEVTSATLATESATESATTSPTEPVTTGETGSSTGDPSDSETESSTDPTDSGSTSDSSTSGDSDGSSGDNPSTGTDPSTSGTPMTMSGTDSAPVDTSSEDSSGGTGGSDGDGGCSCSTDGAPDPIAALGVLALFGLRLRRRR